MLLESSNDFRLGVFIIDKFVLLARFNIFPCLSDFTIWAVFLSKATSFSFHIPFYHVAFKKKSHTVYTAQK
jgi:hypothetical protein